LAFQSFDYQSSCWRLLQMHVLCTKLDTVYVFYYINVLHTFRKVWLSFRFRFMVFNTTFNNISAWRSVILVGKPEYLEKTTDLSQVTGKHFQIMLCRAHLTMHCTGSCKSTIWSRPQQPPGLIEDYNKFVFTLSTKPNTEDQFNIMVSAYKINNHILIIWSYKGLRYFTTQLI
jgi:hypothetical protein